MEYQDPSQLLDFVNRSAIQVAFFMELGKQLAPPVSPTRQKHLNIIPMLTGHTVETHYLLHNSRTNSTEKFSKIFKRYIGSYGYHKPCTTEQTGKSFANYINNFEHNESITEEQCLHQNDNITINEYPSSAAAMPYTDINLFYDNSLYETILDTN